MGWENTIGNDDQAIEARWQWRMQTPKSEADSTAPSFKDVWQAINPLQHIPVVGSIYRALTGDVPSPTARAVGGLLFGGPVGMLVAGVAGAVTQASGGDPIERSVAKLAGKDVPPAAEVASAAAPADTAMPVATAKAAEAPAAPVVKVPEAVIAEKKKPVAVETAAAATPDDPYARFQPKRLAVQPGNSIAQNLAALNAMQLTAPPAPAEPARAAVPTALKPAAVAAAEKPADRSVAVVQADNAAAPVSPAAGITPPGVAPDAPPKAWFSQAMMGALDRYREAGGLRPPSPVKGVDTRR